MFSPLAEKTLIVVPARWASSRLPGKPLADIGGKTMIERVVERCLAVPSASRTVVATDDARIFERVRAVGFEAVMTSPTHASGTDRVAEAARSLDDCELVVNVQGDEPFIRPEQIEALIDFLKNTSFSIATLAKRIETEEALFDPNVVKAVFSKTTSKALFFSRNPIPFVRNHPKNQWIASGHEHWKHIGLYGFRRSVLEKLSALAPSPLEKAESLEQLRWLENGFEIGVLPTEWETAGVDSLADLERARAIFESKNN